MNKKFVLEPSRRIPIVLECDVLVCGGGAAGYCAAIAAARNGAKTALIERGGFLGGSATQALVLPLMTFHASPKDQVVRGIAEEIVREVVLQGGSPGHIPDPLGCAATVTPADPEILKLAIMKLTSESGVTMLLNTQAVAPWLKNQRVMGALIENKSGRGAVRAKVTVDATGDADLAARAKAPFVIGRSADHKTQPMTLMFRLGRVDGRAVRRYVAEHPDDFVLADAARKDLKHLPFLAVSGFFSLVKQAQAEGRLGDFRDRVLYFEMPQPGEVMVNMTRVTGSSGVDAKSLSGAALRGLNQAREALTFLKTSVPGFSSAVLIETASQIGVRETRHVCGRYTLTAEDVLSGRDFKDSVARGAFPIDIHAPEGAGLTLMKMKPGASYGIPYRCLLPQKVEGLLVTGRAISATHEAAASARLSPTCMALGQAAGTAAALCAKTNSLPSALDADVLRRELTQQGAVV